MKTVCHCNVKENAQLIADILDMDVRGEVYETKAKAIWEEWKNYPVIYGRDNLYVCSICSAKFTETSRYCPCCGALMDEIKTVADYSNEGGV